jgi:(1->4)-alpha-D-glucan 1-alpha-D-glucosylmutase
MWNALSRLTVHLASPGVPDVYQGDELWFQALVDPDNRRPVDWATREERLASVRRACESGAEGVPPRAVLRRWCDDVADGTLKLYLTTRLLCLRREEKEGALTGGYCPLRRRESTPNGSSPFGVEASWRIVPAPRLTRRGGGRRADRRAGDTRSPDSMAVAKVATCRVEPRCREGWRAAGRRGLPVAATKSS